jgi:hypothetical protein
MRVGQVKDFSKISTLSIEESPGTVFALSLSLSLSLIYNTHRHLFFDIQNRAISKIPPRYGESVSFSGDRSAQKGTLRPSVGLPTAYFSVEIIKYRKLCLVFWLSGSLFPIFSNLSKVSQIFSCSYKAVYHKKNETLNCCSRDITYWISPHEVVFI